MKKEFIKKQVLNNKGGSAEKLKIIKDIIQKENIELFHLIINNEFYLFLNELEIKAIHRIEDKTTRSFALQEFSKINTEDFLETILQCFQDKIYQKNSMVINSNNNCLIMIEKLSSFINKHFTYEEKIKFDIKSIQSLIEYDKINYMNKTHTKDIRIL